MTTRRVLRRPPAVRRHLGRPALLVGAVAAVGMVAPVAPAVAAPPPDRAYELVSPIDDPSGSVAGLTSDLVPAPGIASNDGDRLIYGAVTGLGLPWSGQTNSMVFGRRTADGWRARTATVSIDHGNTPLQIGGTEAQWGWPTADGRGYLFGSTNLGAVPTGPEELLPGIFGATDDGTPPAWLTRPTDGITPVPNSNGDGVQMVLFANRDRSVLALEANMPLTASAPAAPARAVYARREDQLELVSRMPDGSLPTSSARLGCASHSLQQLPARTAPATTMAACSALVGDGRFVLFDVGLQRPSTGPDGLFVRDLQQQVTRQIAGPAVGLPDSGLVAASRDGARAYFDRSGVSGVYEVDLTTGASTLRSAITGQPLGLSPSGRQMLFLEQPSAGNGNNWTLRYWDGEDSPGTSVSLGTVGPVGAMSSFGGDAQIRVDRVRDAGRTWIFSAVGSLDPQRPSASATTLQLYRWQVGDSAPTCISCSPVDGVARTSGVNLTVQETIGTEVLTAPTVTATNDSTGFGFSTRKLAEPGNSVSDDGRWILFDSPDRLVDADENDVRDVYLWDGDAPAGQQLQLVTSGQGNTPSYALDLDPSGRNAFFSTREGLVRADRNDNYNVYVARIDGGFPDPEPPCGGEEACRPPVIGPPAPGPVGSGTLTPPSQGAKQPAQTGTPKLRVRSVRTASRRLTVRIDTPRAGRLRVTGKAVRTTSRTAKRAATYTLRVPLSASARRQVANGRTVKVALRVAFTAQGAKKASVVRTTVSVRKGR